MYRSAATHSEKWNLRNFRIHGHLNTLPMTIPDAEISGIPFMKID